MQIVRAYTERDYSGVRTCMIALQEFERALDARLPAGPAMADAYLATLFERCARYAGRLFVAETESGVSGFVSVLGAYCLDAPCDDPTPYAYVDDLVVLEEHRGCGLGRALLRQAEHYAQQCGRSTIRLRVKGGNRHALAFYGRDGYADFERELEKRINVEH